MLDRAALGLDVTIFAHVKLSTQGRDAIAAFAEAIRERPEVLDCYTTMGEWDFMLRIVTRDIKAYEAFYLDHLSKLPYRPVDQLVGHGHRDQGNDRASVVMSASGGAERWTT